MVDEASTIELEGHHNLALKSTCLPANGRARTAHPHACGMTVLVEPLDRIAAGSRELQLSHADWSTARGKLTSGSYVASLVMSESRCRGPGRREAHVRAWEAGTRQVPVEDWA